MVFRFKTDPDTAHRLTALNKKHGFYFRTLTRTDHTDTVTCEVTQPGYEFICKNDIPANFN